jgi:hypothetical protein
MLPDDYPTSPPELNPAENAQNQLRQLVQQLCKDDDRFSWSGNTRAKMTVLRKAIAVLDADKPQWSKLFKSLKCRYKWVAEHDDDLLKNLIGLLIADTQMSVCVFGIFSRKLSKK